MPENMNHDAMPTMDLGGARYVVRSSGYGVYPEPDTTRLSCVDCPGTQRCNRATVICEEFEACSKEHRLFVGASVS